MSSGRVPANYTGHTRLGHAPERASRLLREKNPVPHAWPVTGRIPAAHPAAATRLVLPLDEGRVRLDSNTVERAPD
jgi:hypothetical protein